MHRYSVENIKNHDADNFECESTFFSLSLSFLVFVSPFRIFARNRFASKKNEHFFACKFRIVCITLCCAVAACSVVPVNLAYGFSFPFYLNKLSYLKSPPVQAHASGAATAVAAFFLFSFVLFFCHSNRNEL